MFAYRSVAIYKKSKVLNKEIFEFLLMKKDLDYCLRDQLRRASLSIVLNIAEGSSRFSNADRGRFYVMSRGSAFESAAILDILYEEGSIDETKALSLNTQLEEISKTLFFMIKNLKSEKSI